MLDASGSKNATFVSHKNSPDLQLCGRPSLLLEASEEEWMKKAREMIAPLLGQAACVQVFKGRWMVISMRLQCLSDALNSVCEATSLQNVFYHHRNTPSQVVASLIDGKDLVQKSIDLSYCGKLLMQSNLDALVTKLDHHLRDLKEVQSCINHHERALAITTAMTSDGYSAQNSSKKLKKEQLWSLFAKLRSGNADSKIVILESLIDYLQKDDKAALLIENEGDVSHLIRLLDSSIPAIKDRAAHIVSMMARVDECKKSLMAEGVMQPLLRVLESGSSVAKEKASFTLFELSFIAESVHAVASQGSAITLLVKLCKQGTGTGMVGAGGALCNLARNEHVHRVLVENGAVDAFISMLTCSSAEARQYAAKALHNLASGKDDEVRNIIARQGGVQSLVMFLKRELSADAQETAIETLGKLATSATNVRALVLAGYVAHLTELLNTGCPRMQHLAALAMCNLSAYMDLKMQTHREPVIQLSEARGSSEHKMTSPNAVLVMGKHSNMDEKRVSALSNLLKACKHSLTKNVSLSAFLTLSSSSMQRRCIISPETQPPLEKLTDKKVTGANKFLRNVKGKKLLHLLNRKARSKRKPA